MSANRLIPKIIEELDTVLSGIDSESIEALIDQILNAERIFLAGAGRSGLMIKAAAMRLMHLGLQVFVVGETVTPAITKKDLLIIGSGSGETASLVSMAQKASAIGAAIGLITIFPDSSIGRMASSIIEIAAPTPKSDKVQAFKSIQPMGSLFEQSMLLTLDSMIISIMDKLDNNSDGMFVRHANLE
jgi:6-phospho-3-hexuloisomerase